MFLLISNCYVMSAFCSSLVSDMPPSALSHPQLAPPSTSSAPPARQASASYHRPPSPRPGPPPPKRRKKKAGCVSDNVETVSHTGRLSAEKERDESDIYGEHIAAQMKHLTSQQQLMACIEIDKVLLTIRFPPAGSHFPSVPTAAHLHPSTPRMPGTLPHSSQTIPPVP